MEEIESAPEQAAARMHMHMKESGGVPTAISGSYIRRRTPKKREAKGKERENRAVRDHVIIILAALGAYPY